MIVNEGCRHSEPNLGRQYALTAVCGGATQSSLGGALVQRGDAVDHKERAELGRKGDALVIKAALGRLGRAVKGLARPGCKEVVVFINVDDWWRIVH